MRGIILISIIVLMTALFGCGGGGGKSTLESGTPVEASSIDKPNETGSADDGKIATVEAVTSAEEYNTVGEFVAQEEISLSTKVGGTVLRVNVDVGDVVTDGDIIAQIDKEDYRLRLDSAKAQLNVAEAGLNSAKREFARKERLFREDPPAIPESAYELVKTQLEMAEAQFNSAKVAVQIAQKAMNDTDVKAEITGTVGKGKGTKVKGVVSERRIVAGEHAASGAVLLKMIIIQPIKMKFSVPERFAADISKGSPVSAKLRAFPERDFSGSVSLVNPTVDPATRTLLLEAEFANEEAIIKPGFFAECKLTLARTTTYYLVPNEALHISDGRTEVMVVPEGGGDPVAVQVTLVERLGSRSKLVGPLQGGMKVTLR
jgi:membrane fusion protein (multidrug efflux system)